MIVFPEVCNKCGAMPTPTKVACDQCGKEQEIEDFTGVIVHFTSDSAESTEVYSDDFIIDSAEFHFCNMKCLSEFITDPNDDSFDKYEDCSVNIITDSKNLGELFHTIARYSI